MTFSGILSILFMDQLIMLKIRSTDIWDKVLILAIEQCFQKYDEKVNLNPI